ncbi:MAG: hypothetical protein WC359_13010 [Dehalococcoidia bacterium]
MRSRRHHNNDGMRQIKTGNTERGVCKLAEKMKIPYDPKVQGVDKIDQGTRRCPYCQYDTSNLALIEQLITWELSADRQELIKTYWHKDCYDLHPSER